MKKLLFSMLLVAASPAIVLTFPTIYPTGTTLYYPDKAWNGYTIFSTPEKQGAVLIDMNGNVVRHWKAVKGSPGPSRILPGGFLVGGSDRRKTHQESFALIQVDWDGNVVWKFDRTEQVVEGGEEPRWMARQHHDWQREGNPVGYYAPGMEPLAEGGEDVDPRPQKRREA